jgi:hypothetical protein
MIYTYDSVLFVTNIHELNLLAPMPHISPAQTNLGVNYLN